MNTIGSAADAGATASVVAQSAAKGAKYAKRDDTKRGMPLLLMVSLQGKRLRVATTGTVAIQKHVFRPAAQAAPAS
ncbi:hypothetical protein [Burkholderia sp. Bp8963]|uniref:hypothetical protein n=1 Tax=Burkholderia sp. Bp8963 TaxID=2184547 RepID=UPI0021AB8784|nr:hypothetical protein [Burkholderia sp. Bp8963]